MRTKYLNCKIKYRNKTMNEDFKDNLEFAKRLDEEDPLRHFRDRFYLEKDRIYMCGNSLGLASKDAEDCILEVLNKWKKEGVKIWNVDSNKYYLYSSFLARLMAPLVGVDDDELVIVESTTATIHQALSTFYHPTADRYKIVVDDVNFPTDRYAVDSQVRLKGYDPEDAVKVVKCKGQFMSEDDIIEALTTDVAIVFLPTVYYRTAQVLDMERISKAARENGIIVGWDLCHAIGSLEIDLKSLDIDFAVWCTYKYLNGGPGSSAALYINRKHFDRLPGLAGWYGNKSETQFLLRQEFDHQKDAGGWQIGSPCLLAQAALEGSLKMFLEAGMDRLRKKSLIITSYLMYLVDTKLTKHGFAIGNLREDHRRGGHVSLEHEEAYRISLAMKQRGVVADFREPNVIRVTPTAFYTTYVEVHRVVDILQDIVETESYKDISDKRIFVV